LVIIDQDIWVLFTIRSEKLHTSPGMSCFPGGKQDTSDSSILDTALRESEEEIGLKREHVQIIGGLEPILSGQREPVYPFVGIVSSDYIPKFE